VGLLVGLVLAIGLTRFWPGAFITASLPPEFWQIVLALAALALLALLLARLPTGALRPIPPTCPAWRSLG